MTAKTSLRHKITAGLTSLKGSPRDLFIVFVLKVLESYNYFSLSRIFVLYLTEDFGVDDLTAGTLYGLWGTLLTLYGFFLGSAIDVLGVRNSLVVCFILNVTSRLVMATTTSRWVLLASLLGPNTIAGALGVPVMTIGVKRYTHSGNRGFAFSLFYTLMNIAALAQGMLMDVFRIQLKHGFHLPMFDSKSLLNNGNRLFLASGEHGMRCITSAAGLWLTFLLSKTTVGQPEYAALQGVPEEDGVVVGQEGSGAGSQPRSPGLPAQLPGKDEPVSQPSRMEQIVKALKNVAFSREFVKYLAMCIITVNLKSVFRYLDAMLPKYQLRAFGCDAPIGLIYSINPFTIVFLVPLVGALTTSYDHFDMIHVGSYLSALSPFWLVAWPAEWAAAMFVLMLSVGEAVWSPRWYDYSMAVAPDGKEGIFTALASAPLFFAMLPTGVMSGYLLERFCPDNGECSEVSGGGANLAPKPAPGGECRGPIMWFVVATLTLTSPLLILATQRWIRPAPSAPKPGEDSPDALPFGESVDHNEADPLLLVENAYRSEDLFPSRPTPRS